MHSWRWTALAVAFSVGALGRCLAADAVAMPKVDEYRAEQIEGWTFHVSPRLYEADHAPLREQALRLAGNQLFSVKQLLPEERIADLVKVPIWVDLESPLRSLQYHPSRDWLVEHGHHGEMAKAIHMPNVHHFVAARHTNQQPWAMLHELAHAYHDRVLGFDHEEIESAYKRVKEAALYDSVLHVVGDNRQHYALTNHKEFFAEMTECYVGTNDFFPFVRGELKRHDEATYDLLRKIWGDVGR